MARRRKKSRRRRATGIKLLNVAESLAYANIATTQIFGTDAYDFVTGKDNLKLGPSATYMGVYGAALQGYDPSTGADKITLREVISSPTVSMAVAQANLTNNWQSLVLQSVGVQIGFKLGKRIMRSPINNLNKNFFKPLGVGISL